MTKLIILPEIKTIVDKWQLAMAELREPEHVFPVLTEQADLLQAELTHLRDNQLNTVMGKLHRDKSRELYYKNSSFILDYLACYAPQLIYGMVTQYEDSAWGISSALWNIPSHLAKYVDQAYYYMDDVTRMPFIGTERLYLKVQWMEWLFHKLSHLSQHSQNIEYPLKLALNKFIGRRLPATKERLDKYAEENGLTRISHQELERQFDAAHVIKVEEKVAANPTKTIPIVNDSPKAQAPAADEKESSDIMYDVPLDDSESESESHDFDDEKPLPTPSPYSRFNFSQAMNYGSNLFYGLKNTIAPYIPAIISAPEESTEETNSNVYSSSITSLSFSEQQESDGSEPTLKIVAAPDDEEEDEKDSDDTTLIIDKDKELLIRELQYYIHYLRKDFLEQKKEYKTLLVGRLFNYPASVKEQAALKMIQVLRGEEVEMTPAEVNALNTKSLDKIIQKHRNKVQLPGDAEEKVVPVDHKDKIIEKLRAYISQRQAETISSGWTQYHLWSKMTGYPAPVKTSAANKMILLLSDQTEHKDGQPITLSDEEIGALRNGTLSYITKELESLHLLPTLFTEGEHRKMLHAAASHRRAPQQQ